MVFAVPGTASAYDTYVGLKIESVNNPNADIPTEWCLNEGATMTINDGTEDINTVTTLTETCSGDTIWSSLVSLTADQVYSIGLETYDVAANVGVHKEGNYVWFGDGAMGDSCDSFCQSLGGTCVDPGVHDTDLSCTEMESMMDEIKTCSSSADNSAPSGWMEGATYQYYRVQTTSGNYTCSGTGAYGMRFCTCTGVSCLNYTFSFTAPAA